jgi:uncharacterized lipoprotein YajG
MKRLIVLAALISFAGCTTLQPIEGTANELQSRINAGGLLTAGDRVSIVSADAKRHIFRVRVVKDGIIEGGKDRVSVDQIVSVQKRKFSRGKTFLLVGCGVAFTGFILYAAAHAAPAFALGGGP